MRPRAEKSERVLILRELELGPATAYDLAEAVGITVRNMRPYLKLLAEEGLIKRKGFERRPHTRGPNPPIWILKN